MNPGNKTLFSKVIEVVSEHRDIVLATHIIPDGDAIGSLLGLALMLRQLDKHVIASWGNRFVFPAPYGFLAGQDLLVSPEDLPQTPSLFIALDCGSHERLGSLEKHFKRAVTTVNIDHHRNNPGYADINVVDFLFASTAEMIYEFGNESGIQLNKNIAENLYTGIVTDTGRFQYSNTTSRTFTVAAELVGYGVDPARIFRHVYENTTLSRLKLAGAAFDKTVFDSSIGFIYTTITKEDFARTGSDLEDTENLIDSLRAVAGVRAAAVFKETEGGLRVSLRSTGAIDVGRIAEDRHGGGHRLAAGYNAPNDLDRAIRDLTETIAKAAR